MVSAFATRSVWIFAAFFAAFAAQSSAQTFGGSNPITVSSSLGASVGSNASVSGLSGTVTSISVTFTNLNVTNLNSVAIVLKAPSTGPALDLFSGTCNSANATLTIADTGGTGPNNFNGM